jgi:4-hydroxy 2-oxovalerate aldolase
MGLDDRVSCCPDGLVTDRRRRIQVLDCTIRDGGICNDFHFDHEAVQRTFEALVRTGVDYMEIGYRSKAGLFDRNKFGPWRFCDEKDLERAGVLPGKIKMATMVDVGKIERADIPKKSDTVIDAVRIATYAHQMDGALDLLEHCLESGYETFVNVMAVSTLQQDEVDAFLLRLRGSGVHNVALVDSFGALYPYHVRYLLKKYMNYLGQDIKVGVHMHNNQQNAFANSIAAIDEGVDFVDATIHGIGRGAGNCPLELLLLYLDNPKYDPRHILDMVEWFAFLRDDLRWGYHVPYVISGYFNVHPRVAMERMAREDRYQVREMYETLLGRTEPEKKQVG